MTAPSPVQLAVTDPNYTVTSDGAVLPTSAQVISIDVWTGVNKVPKARLVVSDGSASAENFPLSDSATLIPGAKLTISMGYNGNLTDVFSGVVYRMGLEASTNGPPRLVVEATDPAMVMTLARQNAIFTNSELQITDSEVCEKLITQAQLKPDVTTTTVTHESIVQYYSTSWDLLVMRAQASGMVVIANDGTVTVKPPDTSTAPVLTLTYGVSILDFQAEMDASTQFTAASIQSFAWDPATQSLATSGSAQAGVTTPGNLTSDTLAGVFNIGAYAQQTAGALQTDELTQWSSAELLQAKLAKIRGTARFLGSALATPGCMVTLAGVGDRFNGNAYVSDVHHSLEKLLWRTSIGIGLSPHWFAATAPRIEAPGASGQMPSINDLQIGTVKQIDQDPDGEFRVLVTVPLLQATGGAALWARFGSYYASNAVGSLFYPEIGDEVVLAFLSGDPRSPVILGSLYSKKNPPPFPAATPNGDPKNNTKSIVSRSLMHLDFIEDKQAIQLTTPAKQSIRIDDTAKSIVLTDANGNTVTMDANGIAIDSKSDIKLTATGSVTISAGTSLTLSGQSTAKLTSGGVVQVKGSTVALNP